jgi:hypothetical protein
MDSRSLGESGVAPSALIATTSNPCATRSPNFVACA